MGVERWRPGKRLDGGVLSSRLAGTRSGLDEPECELTCARVKCYICRVVGHPQLGINRFGSPNFLDMKTGSSTLIVDRNETRLHKVERKLD
jgi:hypothetical protein